MKTTPVVAKAAESPKSIRSAAPQGKVTEVSESQSLSIERVASGASTETTILTKMLERTEADKRLRHWGINE